MSVLSEKEVAALADAMAFMPIAAPAMPVLSDTITTIKPSLGSGSAGAGEGIAFEAFRAAPVLPVYALRSTHIRETAVIGDTGPLAGVHFAPKGYVPGKVWTQFVAGTEIKIRVRTEWKWVATGRGRPRNPTVFVSSHLIPMGQIEDCYQLAVAEHMREFWPDLHGPLHLLMAQDGSELEWNVVPNLVRGITVEGL